MSRPIQNSFSNQSFASGSNAAQPYNGGNNQFGRSSGFGGNGTSGFGGNGNSGFGGRGNAQPKQFRPRNPQSSGSGQFSSPQQNRNSGGGFNRNANQSAGFNQQSGGFKRSPGFKNNQSTGFKFSAPSPQMPSSTRPGRPKMGGGANFSKSPMQTGYDFGGPNRPPRPQAGQKRESDNTGFGSLFSRRDGGGGPPPPKRNQNQNQNESWWKQNKPKPKIDKNSWLYLINVFVKNYMFLNVLFRCT